MQCAEPQPVCDDFELYHNYDLVFVSKQRFLMLEPIQYSINIAGAGLEKVSIFFNATDNVSFLTTIF